MSHQLTLPRHALGTLRKTPIMTQGIDLFAAAPSLMKTWFGASSAIAASLEDGEVAAIYIVRNPDKLRHLH